MKKNAINRKAGKHPSWRTYWLENGATQTFLHGQYLFYEGNLPLGAHLVLEGLVKITTWGPSGRGLILRIAQPGDLVGHRSLMAQEPLKAAAIAQGPVKTSFLPKALLIPVKQPPEDLTSYLLQEMARAEGESESRLLQALDASAPARTAQALLTLKERFPGEVWTRKDIAEWAGTSPETVMRCLSQWAQQGWISLKGRTIGILRPQTLLRLAKDDSRLNDHHP